MKFLFVRSDVCRRLLSDSNSRWTPLPLAMQFPLLGLTRDLHPLDNAHAERTNTKNPSEFLPMDFFVIRLRFERRTHSLEGCCSIQLSYRTIFFKSVAKVRQFIENSNNLPKFFIRKLRQNLSNSLKWAIYEHLTSIEVMIWQQSQFLQHADVCCQTALLCCKVTIAARNNNRLLE